MILQKVNHCQKGWTFHPRDKLSAASHFQNGGQNYRTQRKRVPYDILNI